MSALQDCSPLDSSFWVPGLGGMSYKVTGPLPVSGSSCRCTVGPSGPGAFPVLSPAQVWWTDLGEKGRRGAAESMTWCEVSELMAHDQTY